MMLSEIRRVGALRFPVFSGIRIMMMPFRIEDPIGTVPDALEMWRPAVYELCRMSPAKRGVGYLTIDEAFVPTGRTHRRPGLHVDGIGPDGKCGGWGGGGGGWGARGMLVAASHVGCRGWSQMFHGHAGPNGDSEHLRWECDPASEIIMQAGEVYWCGPTAVHESLPMKVDVRRQFVRLSMPSDAPWYDGYTRNPLGVEPTGPIHPARSEFMAYRPVGEAAQ
jgi:hypothetical protein